MMTNGKETDKLKDTQTVGNSEPSPEKRVARLEMSERFLNVLIAKVKERSLKSAEGVIDLYYAFRKKNSGLGDDFDLAHTWRIAELRASVNKCLIENGGEEVPLDAAETEIVLALLEVAAFGAQTQ